MPRPFAREICARMAADSPDKYSGQHVQGKRRGKIFLDYLRNDRMSTAVAPLVASRRAGATVSMPLEWSAVKKGLDPTASRCGPCPGLLAKSKAWIGLRQAEKPLLPVRRARLEVSGALFSIAVPWLEHNA
jgi:bifunctional non-homologous end joining protein LigD